MRRLLDSLKPKFSRGGKLEKLYPLYEATDTFLYSPGEVTSGTSHVRDSLDMKRMMITVVVALIPCIVMAMWNTGYQANLAISSNPQLESSALENWRGSVLSSLGQEFDPESHLANLLHGALYFIPLYLITNIAGGICEAVFACIRKHEINEGFLVTGMLFPLTLPPTIPWWQAVLGIIFGVVIGKEIFGGTGRNFLNPALTGRAFLYFSYAPQMIGEEVWVAVDGYTAATPLGALATADLTTGMDAITGANGLNISWTQAFLGTIPGSLGETSVVACLIGAAILIATGIGSWRIMTAMLIGAMGFSGLLYWLGTGPAAERITNSMFLMPPWWHLTLGGLAFGLVFMATDPVSAAMTEPGKWVYGILIGVMAILIRVLNPAYPEGVMLAILFGNVFAPLIDWFVVQANIKRRRMRNAA